MAAPTPTARATPSGVMLEEGFKCLITFARRTNICIWEKTVKPTGIDGGDKIDITTMHNTRTKTFAPRTLYMPTDGSIKVAYDAKAKNDIKNILINAEDTITETYPDGSTYCYYGYLKSFEPSEFSEGEFPEADVVIVQTNWDPTNNVEAEAVLTEVVGT